MKDIIYRLFLILTHKNFPIPGNYLYIQYLPSHFFPGITRVGLLYDKISPLIFADIAMTLWHAINTIHNNKKKYLFLEHEHTPYVLRISYYGTIFRAEKTSNYIKSAACLLCQITFFEHTYVIHFLTLKKYQQDRIVSENSKIIIWSCTKNIYDYQQSECLNFGDR